MIEPLTVDLSLVAHDVGLDPQQVETVVKFYEEGYSVPFIARYRKDETHNLREEELWAIVDKYRDVQKLNERKQKILHTISVLGKLTDDLEKKIRGARSKRSLDDLYLPFKQKRQTLAASAREKGLEPLAMKIFGAEAPFDLNQAAAEFISEEKKVASAAEALEGAGHIISALFCGRVDLRQALRDYISHNGKLVSTALRPFAGAADGKQSDKPQSEESAAAQTPAAEKEKAADGGAKAAEQAPAEQAAETAKPADTAEVKESAEPSDTAKADDTAKSAEPAKSGARPGRNQKQNKKKSRKTPAQVRAEQKEKLYSDYFDFSTPLRGCPAHRVMTLNRGEQERVLRVRVDYDRAEVEKLAQQTAGLENHPQKDFLETCLSDALTRLILPSVEREIRSDRTERAERQSLVVFAKNLRNLLLQKPLYRRRVLALDPGFRHGCKLAALDEFGNFLANETVFITGSAERRGKAAAKLVELIKRFNLTVIAIGNGTGCREAEDFVAKMIAEHFADQELVYIIVNEAGASIYSTSIAAQEELPQFDPLVRGAISIGRRLQDPLNELVKIDPENLGIGLYQHDLKRDWLQESLRDVVESCVNYVGVDLNTATPAILRYVAGLKQALSKRVYEYRRENGPFRCREDLKKVNGLGDAVFKNCAGFLRIADGSEPLDSTWIHPESYELAEKILKKIGYAKENLLDPEKRSALAELVPTLKTKALAVEFGAGVMTVADILEQFKRPGRDPRSSSSGPIFKKGVMKIEDLKPGMELTGTVLNVVDFGAFVDIGLHDSGLVHISRMKDKYVSDAHQYLAVGDVIKVWVVDVDQKRSRISLSMIAPGSEDADRQGDRDPHRGRGDRSRDDRPREDRPRAEREGREERRGRDDRSRDDRPRGERRQRRERGERQTIRSVSLPAERSIKPISDEMKQGKEPMRSFSDLAQLFGRIQPTEEGKKKPAKQVSPPEEKSAEAKSEPEGRE